MKMIFKFDRLINTILRIIVMIMLSIMSIVVFAQVIFRIVHLSIPWSEELSKYLLIWCTFLWLCHVYSERIFGWIRIFKEFSAPKTAKIIADFLKSDRLFATYIFDRCWLLGCKTCMFPDHTSA